MRYLPGHSIRTYSAEGQSGVAPVLARGLVDACTVVKFDGGGRPPILSSGMELVRRFPGSVTDN